MYKSISWGFCCHPIFKSNLRKYIWSWSIGDVVTRTLNHLARSLTFVLINIAPLIRVTSCRPYILCVTSVHLYCILWYGMFYSFQKAKNLMKETVDNLIFGRSVKYKRSSNGWVHNIGSATSQHCAIPGQHEVENMFMCARCGVVLQNTPTRCTQVKKSSFHSSFSLLLSLTLAIEKQSNSPTFLNCK